MLILHLVMDDADLSLALRSVVFAAVGTAGQRCTSVRRLYLHEKIHDSFLEQLKEAYGQVKVGDPTEAGILCGPLHTAQASEAFKKTIAAVQSSGGQIVFGGRVFEGPGNYVEPTIASVPADSAVVQEEAFVPILHVVKFEVILSREFFAADDGKHLTGWL